MNLRFFIFLILFSSNHAISQVNANTSNEEIELSLKGKVKSFYKTTTYIYQDSDLSTTNKERFRLHDVHLLFDTRGNLSSRLSYYTDGNIREIYTFDSYGNKIEVIENNPQGNLNSRWLYVYNSDNKLTEIKKYDEENDLEYRHLLTYKNGKIEKDVKYKNIRDIISEKIYTYNSNGSLTGVKAYNSKAQVDWEIQNEYDTKDRLKTLTSINSKGRKNYYSVYSYDENDNRIEEVRYDLNDDILFTHVYRYDELNRKTEEIEFDSFNYLTNKKNYGYHKNGYLEIEYDFTFKAKNEVDEVILTRFDKNKKVLEKTMTDAIGNVLKKQTFKYNRKGLLLSYTHADLPNDYHHTGNYKYNLKGNAIGGSKRNFQKNELNSEKFTYQYSFDKQGNWIKRIRVVNDKQSVIEERKLEYY